MKTGDLVRCTFKDYGIGIITMKRKFGSSCGKSVSQTGGWYIGTMERRMRSMGATYSW